MKTKITAIITAFLIFAGSFSAFAISTPYTETESDMINGATYELPSSDFEATVSNDLRIMKNVYRINTVNVYGLENLDRAGSTRKKDILFKLLKQYEMKITVRIENYSSDFSFAVSDIDYIMNHYSSLLSYVCGEDKRDRVEYFALNMPVDDPVVQSNAGGLNSNTFISKQLPYAKEFVKRMRKATAERGFCDAKLFLSVFYGWDNTYNTPSYKEAQDDGYFLNNYSYPKNNTVAGDSATDAELINAERLSVAMNRYRQQYNNAPLVIEYGFHTAEYNNGSIADQTAGLVATKLAKSRAVKATADFYRLNYDFVCGFQYFGYNLVKQEGNDGLFLDWQLIYDEEKELVYADKPQIRNGSFTDGTQGFGITDGFGDTAYLVNGPSNPVGKALAVVLGTGGRELFQSTGWFGSRCYFDGAYKFTAKINTAELLNGNFKLTVEMKNGGAAEKVYSTEFYNLNRGGWNNYSVEVPENAVGYYDEVLFKVEFTSGNGVLYVTDLNVSKNDSLLYNGSFEMTNNNSALEWGMYPSWNDRQFIDKTESFDGFNSIKINISPEQNYSLYSTPVKNNVKGALICSVKIKYENATGVPIYFHLNRGENNVINSESYILSGSSNGYTEISFKANGDFNALYAQFQAEIGRGSGTVWLDDIKIKEYKCDPCDVNADGKVDIRDLIVLKKGLNSALIGNCLFDIDGNGLKNAEDITLLRKKLFQM